MTRAADILAVARIASRFGATALTFPTDSADVCRAVYAELDDKRADGDDMADKPSSERTWSGLVGETWLSLYVRPPAQEPI